MIKMFDLKIITRVLGWVTWLSIVIVLYGFGWKFGWENMMSKWDFPGWLWYDWIIFVAGIAVAHVGVALLTMIAPLLLKRYIGFKDVVTNSTP